MMYKSNFVAVIKRKGSILRENNEGVVRLPFGSEYTILLKNKDSRRAVVDVEIDDRDAATGIIIPANTSMELKGFLKGLNVKNRFRFIQKTKEIQEYRGDRLGDGLVRVEYRFEKEQELPWITVSYPPIQPVKPIWPAPGPTWTYHSSETTGDFKGGVSTYNCSCDQMTLSNTVPAPDEGITVKGSKTHQGFVYGSVNELESKSSVIILHLRGATVKRRKVKRAITVKTRLTCSTCGRKSKSSQKFCGNCGTYLE